MLAFRTAFARGFVPDILPAVAPILLLVLVLPGMASGRENGVQQALPAPEALVVPVGSGQPDVSINAFEAVPTWHMTRGAEVLPAGHGAFEIAGGMPSAGIQFDFGVLGFMEVSPHLSYTYLWYMAYDLYHSNLNEAGMLALHHGMTFGLLLRFGLYNKNGNAISLSMDTSLLLAEDQGYKHYGASFCSLEMKYSHRWDNPRIAAIAGFRLPYWIQDGRSSVPILVEAGFEYGVARNVNVHLMVEGGVAITGDLYEEEWYVGPAVGCQAGVSILW